MPAEKSVARTSATCGPRRKAMLPVPHPSSGTRAFASGSNMMSRDPVCVRRRSFRKWVARHISRISCPKKHLSVSSCLSRTSAYLASRNCLELPNSVGRINAFVWITHLTGPGCGPFWLRQRPDPCPLPHGLLALPSPLWAGKSQHRKKSLG